MDLLCFLCLVFLLLSRLFISVLWSPAGADGDVYCYFSMWYSGSGVVLDRIVS